ncbi:LysM peptidoglycan-binding domain-containing protein [Bordetella trematum]|uniref:peptidoglycan DD-metalloendopeptidase family protein n=1 Tax=Bordetella trematum TaxID=123899 RepID=UPI00052E78CD|nr:peptidoglycan DD-metalloendopeptidase family protein [Bordetella trematum]QIM72495.1 LysM peptidoglycan-binding domain-containing protein [Bordetella trematum]
MLNGQLPLAATLFMNTMAQNIRRPARWLGVLGLVALAGCASKTQRAPVVDLNNQTSSGAPAITAGSYVVKPGDTLFKIARASNVDIDTIKRLNNLSDPNQIHVGQVLKLSAGTSTASMTPPKPPRPAEPADTSSSGTGSPAEATPVAPPPAPVAPKPVARAADANVINWGWPSSGQITQTFNNSTKGIDLAGTPGDPVVAAADGKVMYSGNGVRGLGNLIIINHNNGFITAYAHNRALLVKTGQEVKRGAKIAELGQSDTTSPKLHFEIRRQGTPVDPMQYLPAR